MISRGTDIDAIALYPPPEPAALKAALEGALRAQHFDPLLSIDALRMDALLEWCEPGERCVAVTLPRSSDDAKTATPRAWQLLYDTEFNSAQLALALSAALPGSTALYFNLQEGADGTVAAFRDGKTQALFCADMKLVNALPPSSAPRASAAEFAKALPVACELTALEKALALLAERQPGERVKKMGPRVGGSGDALQALAHALGCPHLYRFFEGWMKSDLDWDEDDVETVLAFRRKSID
jgi:hypothetical protein